MKMTEALIRLSELLDLRYATTLILASEFGTEPFSARQIALSQKGVSATTTETTKYRLKKLEELNLIRSWYEKQGRSTKKWYQTTSTGHKVISKIAK